MAACGSLQHIFENPLPENSTLLESLSPWSQIKPVNKSNLEQSSFTEIFGELYFKENSNPLFPTSSSSLSSYSSVIDIDPKPKTESCNNEEKKNSPLECSFSSSDYSSCHKNSTDSFSLRNLESLQLCTEGLGFESSDQDLMKNPIKEEDNNWQKQEEKQTSVGNNSLCQNFCGEIITRSKTTGAKGGGGGFPPPISCLSKSNGKPWVCFKSYRHDGRFVLKEVKIHSQEFLHACREDGRLKLHFVQPNDEVVEEEEENDDQDDEDEVDGEKESEEDDENDERKTMTTAPEE